MMNIPVYHSWASVPEGLYTKTQLRERGYKPSKAQAIVGYKTGYKSKWGDYALYALADATPLKPATEAQIAALEKARQMAAPVDIVCVDCGRYVETVTRKQAETMTDAKCFLCIDHEEACEWAREVLADENAVILDTETTDLCGEAIEIAVIDMQGNTLLNQRIKPRKPVSAGALAIHGITNEMLRDQPTFEQVYAEIVRVTHGKRVLIYNYSFDRNILDDQCVMHNLEYFQWAKNSACVMKKFAQWYGDWSNYHESYKWQKLDGGDHTALGDCRATLDTLKSMI